MKKILGSILLGIGMSVVLSACGSSSSSSSDDLYDQCIATYGEGAEQCDNLETLE
jgi:hypothetical protein